MGSVIESTDSKQERLTRAALAMDDHGIDALLLAKPQNVAYLCGQSCPGAFSIVTRDGRVSLGVPSPSLEAVREGAWAEDIRTFRNGPDMLRTIGAVVNDLHLERASVGLEHAFLTQNRFVLFTSRQVLPRTTNVKDATPVMDQLRSVKSTDEIALLRRAADIARIGVETAVRAVREGIPEAEVAGAGELAMREAGAEGIYHTCVISGPRSALGFANPNSRRIAGGDVVLIDMHPIVGGYFGDLCRTVAVGHPGAEAKKAFAAYLQAHTEAVEACRPGTTIQEIESVFARALQKTGRAPDLFGPVLRGIGMDYAESPVALSGGEERGTATDTCLPANAVIVVGGGLLLPSAFGVRLEDMVLVGEDGPQILTDCLRTLV